MTLQYAMIEMGKYKPKQSDNQQLIQLSQSCMGKLEVEFVDLLVALLAHQLIVQFIQLHEEGAEC